MKNERGRFYEKTKAKGRGRKNILHEKAEPCDQHKNLFQTGYKESITYIKRSGK